MDTAALVYGPGLARYDLGPDHPLKPARLTASVALMDAYGLLGEGVVVGPPSADDDTLALVHSREYMETVREASASIHFRPRMGLGTSDNPVFPGMHDASALVVGSAVRALDEVLAGRRRRAFAIAGGLHHAHRERAAGFCVYNDPAVAIAAARRDRPDLRVLYVDIDAHHGDGVQEAFYDSADVMTISMHESGRYLFPGTGFPGEVGEGSGRGYSVNVPMPPYATDDCYRLAFDEAVEPLARAFRPDVVVAQCGVDAHYRDPLTHLGLTIPGWRRLVSRILGLADDVCDGRLAALGGGGYRARTTVPLAWTWLMATLLGRELPERLPEAWREAMRPNLDLEPPRTLGADDRCEAPDARIREVEHETAETVREVREALFPLHRL